MSLGKPNKSYTRNLDDYPLMSETSFARFLGLLNNPNNWQEIVFILEWFTFTKGQAYLFQRQLKESDYLTLYTEKYQQYQNSKQIRTRES